MDDPHAADQALMEAINAGTPIPPVPPDKLRARWELMQEFRKTHGDHDNVTFGVCDPNAAIDDPQFRQELWNIGLRLMILEALQKRALLPLQNDGALDPRVFSAISNIPCAKVDLGQALMLGNLSLRSAAEIEAIRTQLAAEGYDFDNLPFVKRWTAYLAAAHE